jgi:ribonucleoside-diphosphate reductase alpha chain
LKDETAKIIETPAQLFMRISKATAKVDEDYGEDPKESEKIFYEMMARLEFIPNSPTLFNAGTDIGQLSACFVLPVEDSLESIFTAVKNMALIEQTGGGVGFDFSKLRPNGDIVRSTMGVASGPVSFMRVFDTATEVIKAGGKRRGAMMGILRVDHPDILEFITSKQKPGFLSNFNISVAVTDDFMKTLEEDGEYWLINPRNKEKVRSLRAKDVWDLMAKSAWASGDPGVIFIDEINRHNPTPEVGRIESTNPCGEQPLLPYESCNLGSINLSRMVEDGRINWEKLRETVRNAVHFLDNIIDANKYPLKEIEAITKANRKIGLGVMGFADMLIKLGIRYNSEEALELAERLMKFIDEEAHRKSEEIGEKRGSFPNFEKSIWKDKYSTMRNATVTTVAPTGTISIIAGCSSGIEPLFAISFIRNVLGGTRLFETNPLFEIISKERGFYSAKLLEEIARTGSVQKIDEVPEDVKKIFVTALDIEPEWHVRMQAAFQKYTDNAVSKTVNLPYEASVEDVRKVYDLAWKLKCKGVTVFRYGSKPEQVLYIGEIKTKEGKFVSVQSEYAGGCPTQTCPFPA